MRTEWEPEDLIEHWTLLEGDHELIGNKTCATRLGFAVLPKYFGIEAQFPPSPLPPSAMWPTSSGSIPPSWRAMSGRVARSSTTAPRSDRRSASSRPPRTTRPGWRSGWPSVVRVPEGLERMCGTWRAVPAPAPHDRATTAPHTHAVDARWTSDRSSSVARPAARMPPRQSPPAQVPGDGLQQLH